MRPLKSLFFGLVFLACVISGVADPVTNGTIQAQGGNVTSMNMGAGGGSSSWAGFYGNITGELTLSDANNMTFYDWSNASIVGEIYASRNDTISWGTINCTNSTERDQENIYLNMTPDDAESVQSTFNSTFHPEFFVGTVNITSDSCFSTNIFVNGTDQNTSFYQILLSDGDNKTVYTSILEEDAVGFNGEIVDFQIMMGDSENTGYEGPTTYYFYTELG